MLKRVYVFGNRDVAEDSFALQAMEVLATRFPDVEFVEIKPNADLPFENGEDVVLLDVLANIEEVSFFDDSDVERVLLPPRTSAHDFDLGFQLKYLKKLGKLGRVSIIGLPMSEKIDYDRIHSILRKLVAQDMQGS